MCIFDKISYILTVSFIANESEILNLLYCKVKDFSKSICGKCIKKIIHQKFLYLLVFPNGFTISKKCDVFHTVIFNKNRCN